MRREHGWVANHTGLPSGSSRHAPGAPKGDGSLGEPEGIIPACAGSTSPFQDATRVERDHPGMRREHDLPVESPIKVLGSSRHAPGAQTMQTFPA